MMGDTIQLKKDQEGVNCPNLETVTMCRNVNLLNINVNCNAFGMTDVVFAGAHNPQRASSTSSCRGVFTDHFIFRTVLARNWNIFLFLRTSQQNLQT